ncbi:hydroxymethylbilane synthase [soil metagenome]
MKPLILGTRGSELALCQAEMVETALRAAHPHLQIERKVINTMGDKRTDLRFSEFSAGAHLDKGIFTKELEVALENGEIDFAVHSLKDVPTVLDDQFFIAAVLPRAPIEDVLISRDGYTLESLPQGAKVGTSSVRRIREIQWLRPGVDCVEIRGNVPTRLRKLFLPSELDAVLLAKAGLVRLGLLSGNTIKIDGQDLSAVVLSCETFLPAAGQGAVGIEARKNDTVTLEALGAINDADTMARVTAEREFLHILKAGCQTPIGALTSIENHILHMRVLVFDEADNSKAPRDLQASAPLTEPKSLAAALVAQMH